MTLGSAITYTPPTVGGKTFPSVTTSSINVVCVDNPDFQNGTGNPNGRVTAILRALDASGGLHNIPKPLVLWAGAAYQSIGNWTQDQANAQVLELLGSNPAQVLEGLF